MPETKGIRDFLKRNYPRPTYLVDGLIANIGLNIIAGSPNVGKSWLTLDIAKCVSRGESLFGKLETKKQNVLIIELDDHLSVLQDRMKLIGLTNEDNITVWTGERFHLTGDETEAESVINYIKEKNIGLVIIDAFISIHDKNENESVQIMPILKELRTISVRCNCVILLLHHQRKATGFSGREADSIRGSNALEAEAMAILQVSKLSKEKATRLSQSKNKIGKRVEPIYFIIEDTELNGQKQVELRCVEKTKKDDKQNVINAISEFYTNNPDPKMSKDEAVDHLHSETNLSKRSLEEAFMEIVKTGSLQVKQGKRLHNKTLYVWNTEAENI